jgi:hypothetical protein
LKPAIQLNWQTSAAVSCFAAARVLMAGRTLVDSGLAASLAAPVERLQSALNDEHISGEAFWSHVLPLSASVTNLKEVAQVALIKTIGRTEMPARLEHFRRALADVRNAGLSGLPLDEETSAKHQERIKLAWAYQGDGLLHAVAAQTEPEILVEEATVVMVYPAEGGGGAAYLPYNLVHIEAVADDPVPELPEIMRLAWLLSVLNLDLPRYSDEMTPKCLPLVAALAMLPATVAAAAAIGLAPHDEAILRQAMQSWLATPEKTDAWSGFLFQWWEAYKSMRPPLGTALAGLEKLLAESGG